MSEINSLYDFPSDNSDDEIRLPVEKPKREPLRLTVYPKDNMTPGPPVNLPDNFTPSPYRGTGQPEPDPTQPYTFTPVDYDPFQSSDDKNLSETMTHNLYRAPKTAK